MCPTRALVGCIFVLTASPSVRSQFPFMESSAIPARANFFDRPVSDYHGAAVGGGMLGQVDLL